MRNDMRLSKGKAESEPEPIPDSCFDGCQLSRRQLAEQALRFDGWNCDWILDEERAAFEKWRRNPDLENGTAQSLRVRNHSDKRPIRIRKWFVQDYSGPGLSSQTKIHLPDLTAVWHCLPP